MCKSLLSIISRHKNRIITLITFVCLLIVPLRVICQEEGYAKEGHEPDWKNRIAFFTGTSMATIKLEGTDRPQTIFIPTYGISYDRKITSWMAIGVLTELELETYVIETDHGETIDRNYVYVGSVLFFLKTPVKHLVFLFGPGYELSTKQNFRIFKIGFAYDFEISNGWGIAPLVTYDRISNVYQTLTFGLDIGKKF